MPDTLETALRELRDTPSEAFATKLDARVAAGFGRGGTPPARTAPTPPPPRAPRRRLPGWLLPAGGFAVAATLCVVVVAGIAGQAGSDSSAGGGGASSASEAAPAVGQDQSRGSGAGGGSTAAPPSSAPAVPGRTRKVERSASVTLGVEPDEVEAAASRVSDSTARAGGYVESSSVESADEAGFVLRIPVDRLDGAMTALARVGEVTERRQSTQDITASFDQARADLREAQALRTSLLRRLGAADTDAETSSLRARLRDANARIAATQVAVRRVDRRASFARVDVTVEARDGAGTAAEDEEGSGWGIGAAWDDAGRVLEVAAGVLVLALAVLLPLALLAALGLGGRRAAVARARRRVLDTV